MKKQILILFLVLFLLANLFLVSAELSNDFEFSVSSELFISVVSSNNPEIAETIQYSINQEVEALSENTINYLDSIGISYLDKTDFFNKIIQFIREEDRETAIFIAESISSIKELTISLYPLPDFSGNMIELKKDKRIIRAISKTEDISFLFDLELGHIQIDPTTFTISLEDDSLSLFANSLTKAKIGGFQLSKVEEGVVVTYSLIGDSLAKLNTKNGKLDISIDKSLFKAVSDGKFLVDFTNNVWSLLTFDVFLKERQDIKILNFDKLPLITCIEEFSCRIGWNVFDSELKVTDVFIDRTRYIQDGSFLLDPDGKILKIILSANSEYVDSVNLISLMSPFDLEIFFENPNLYLHNNAIILQEEEDNLVVTINADLYVYKGKEIEFLKLKSGLVKFEVPTQKYFIKSPKNTFFLYLSDEETVSAFVLKSDGSVLFSENYEDQSSKEVHILSPEKTKEYFDELSGNLKNPIDQILKIREKIILEEKNRALYIENIGKSQGFLEALGKPFDLGTTGTVDWEQAAEISRQTILSLQRQIKDIIDSNDQRYNDLILAIQEQSDGSAEINTQLDLIKQQKAISRLQLLATAGWNNQILTEISNPIIDSDLKYYYRGLALSQLGKINRGAQEWAKIDESNVEVVNFKETTRQQLWISQLESIIGKYQEDLAGKGSNVLSLRGIDVVGVNPLERGYKKLNVFEWLPSVLPGIFRGDESYTELRINAERDRMNYDQMLVDGLSLFGDLSSQGYTLPEIYSIAYTSDQAQKIGFLGDPEIEPFIIPGEELITNGAEKLASIYGYDELESRMARLTLRNAFEEVPELDFSLKQLSGTVNQGDELSYLLNKAAQVMRNPGEKPRTEAKAYLTLASEIDPERAAKTASILGLSGFNLFKEQFGDVAVDIVGDPLIAAQFGFLSAKIGGTLLTKIPKIGVQMGSLIGGIKNSKAVTSTMQVLNTQLTGSSVPAVVGTVPRASTASKTPAFLKKISSTFSRVNSPSFFQPSASYSTGFARAAHKSLIGNSFKGIISNGDFSEAIHIVELPSLDDVGVYEVYGDLVRLAPGTQIMPIGPANAREGGFGLIETTKGTFPTLFVKSQTIPNTAYVGNALTYSPTTNLPVQHIVAGLPAVSTTSSFVPSISTLATTSSTGNTLPILATTSRTAISGFQMSPQFGTALVNPITGELGTLAEGAVPVIYDRTRVSGSQISEILANPLPKTMTSGIPPKKPAPFSLEKLKNWIQRKWQELSKKYGKMSFTVKEGNLEGLEIKERIDSEYLGSSADVYRGELNGKSVAIKKTRDYRGNDGRRYFTEEIENIKIVEELGLAEYHGKIQFRDGQIGIVTNYVPGHEIPIAQSRGDISLETTKDALRQYRKLWEAGYEQGDFQFLVREDGKIGIIDWGSLRKFTGSKRPVKWSRIEEDIFRGLDMPTIKSTKLYATALGEESLLSPSDDLPLLREIGESPALNKVVNSRNQLILDRHHSWDGLRGKADFGSAAKLEAQRVCTHDAYVCAVHNRVDYEEFKRIAISSLENPGYPPQLKKQIQLTIQDLNLRIEEDQLFELMYVADELLKSGEIEQAKLLIRKIEKKIGDLAEFYAKDIPDKLNKVDGILDFVPSPTQKKSLISFSESGSKELGGGNARKALSVFLRDEMSPNMFRQAYYSLVQSLANARYLQDDLMLAALRRAGLEFSDQNIFMLFPKNAAARPVYVDSGTQEWIKKLPSESVRANFKAAKISEAETQRAIANPDEIIEILCKNGVDPNVMFKGGVSISGIPYPDNPPKIIPKKVDSYIAAAKNPIAKAAREAIVDNLQKITFDELTTQLPKSIHGPGGLDDFLASGEPFAIILGRKPHSSSRWAYELAKPDLVREPFVEVWFGGERNKIHILLDYGIRKFVTFDDVAYSGTELRTHFLAELKHVYQDWVEKSPSLFDNAPPELMIVAPFMTDYSLGFLAEAIPNNEVILKVAPHRKIKTIDDILSEELKRQLEEMPVPGQTLVYTDWKVADGVSFYDPANKFLDTPFTRDYHGYQPPYKDLYTDYALMEAREWELWGYQSAEDFELSLNGAGGRRFMRDTRFVYLP
ncbi:MAG: hypothetical protein ABH817_02110 [archaeon]